VKGKLCLSLTKYQPSKFHTGENMNNLIKTFVAIVVISAIYSPSAYSHCQIPCGIYDDHARVRAMLEDAATTRKSVKLISELSGKSDAQSNNQIVRWVMNKEKHAQNVISTISDYFLTQRVKAKQKDYVERLKKHHAVIVAAMKVKQNADMKYVDALEANIKELLPYYPEHKH
jgi:nickel superoxide dismutase